MTFKELKESIERMESYGVSLDHTAWVTTPKHEDRVFVCNQLKYSCVGGGEMYIETEEVSWPEPTDYKECFSMLEVVDKVLYLTKDPLSPIKDCPALTALLYGVCQNDHKRFEEATRIVGLFIEEALNRRGSKQWKQSLT